MAIRLFFGSGPSFVNRTQSSPGFVDPIRSGPGFVNLIRSDPVHVLLTPNDFWSRDGRWIKPGIWIMEHGTWNIPEHPGTPNNYDNHAQNM